MINFTKRNVNVISFIITLVLFFIANLVIVNFNITNEEKLLNKRQNNSISSKLNQSTENEKILNQKNNKINS